MRKLWIGAALVLLNTSAQVSPAAAEVFNFGINGGTARIEVPRKCRELACLNMSFTDRNGKQYTTKDLDGLIGKDNKDSKVTEAPVASPFGTTAQPAARAPAPAPVTAINPDPPRAVPPRVTAVPRPRYEPEPVRPSADEQADEIQPDPNAVVRVPESAAAAPAPETAAAPAPEVVAPARQPERVANNRIEAPTPMAQPAPTGPVGEWLVEDETAQIRIEECGANLCGYVAQSKTPNDTDRKNPDRALRKNPIIGTQILIDMKPGKSRWDGTIYNPKDGSSYTSHISMRNANTLRVEGCAFGGLFCGGQNWKRVM
jgi:uncharacterized protein (DUF2147 family)